MGDNERKGLRFEVGPNKLGRWTWLYVGADGPVAQSPTTFNDEKETRSHIHANRGRLGNAKRAKVVTVDS